MAYRRVFKIPVFFAGQGVQPSPAATTRMLTMNDHSPATA
jgi:hypothetical protein